MNRKNYFTSHAYYQPDLVVAIAVLLVLFFVFCYVVTIKIPGEDRVLNTPLTPAILSSISNNSCIKTKILIQLNAHSVATNYDLSNYESECLKEDLVKKQKEALVNK